ncbi:hypothetical protein K2X33_09185 [bacterium]|nr:hypothetical protein [bacterium]
MEDVFVLLTLSSGFAHALGSFKNLPEKHAKWHQMLVRFWESSSTNNKLTACLAWKMAHQPMPEGCQETFQWVLRNLPSELLKARIVITLLTSPADFDQGWSYFKEQPRHLQQIIVRGLLEGYEEGYYTIDWERFSALYCQGPGRVELPVFLRPIQNWGEAWSVARQVVQLEDFALKFKSHIGVRSQARLLWDEGGAEALLAHPTGIAALLTFALRLPTLEGRLRERVHRLFASAGGFLYYMGRKLPSRVELRKKLVTQTGTTHFKAYFSGLLTNEDPHVSLQAAAALLRAADQYNDLSSTPQIGRKEVDLARTTLLKWITRKEILLASKELPYPLLNRHGLVFFEIVTSEAYHQALFSALAEEKDWERREKLVRAASLLPVTALTGLFLAQGTEIADWYDNYPCIRSRILQWMGGLVKTEQDHLRKLCEVPGELGQRAKWLEILSTGDWHSANALVQDSASPISMEAAATTAAVLISHGKLFLTVELLERMLLLDSEFARKVILFSHHFNGRRPVTPWLSKLEKNGGKVGALATEMKTHVLSHFWERVSCVRAVASPLAEPGIQSPAN